MDKTLLNEFKSWFSQYHKEKRKNWYGEKCDVLFFQASKGFERLLKQTERAIDTKIDKEISSKKKDRATVTKAIRVSRNKDSEHIYIELRFRDMWDEATEEIFEPYVTSAMQSIIKAQDSFENKTLEDGAF